MNNILEGRFMALITDNNTLEVTEVQSAFNEFKTQLVTIVDNNTHYPTVFRLLTELVTMLEITSRGKKK